MNKLYLTKGLNIYDLFIIPTIRIEKRLCYFYYSWMTEILYWNKIRQRLRRRFWKERGVMMNNGERFLKAVKQSIPEWNSFVKRMRECESKISHKTQTSFPYFDGFASGANLIIGKLEYLIDVIEDEDYESIVGLKENMDVD